MMSNSPPAGKSYVMILNELMSKFCKDVTYDLIFEGQYYTYRVIANGKQATGSAKSKKEAKQEAAKVLLEKLDSESNLDCSVTDFVKTEENPCASFDNAVGKLQQYCAIYHITMPSYTLTTDIGLSHDKMFGITCTVGTYSEEGLGKKKQEAKHFAAQKMLSRLQDIKNINTNSVFHETTKDEFEESNLNIVKKLKEYGIRQAKTSKETEKLMIADFFKIFSSDDFPKSTTLNKYKNKERSYFESLPTPEIILHSVLTELEISVSHGPFTSNNDGCAVWLTIESSPSWTFYGNGSNNNVAYRVACCNALIFLSEMVA